MKSEFVKEIEDIKELVDLAEFRNKKQYVIFRGQPKIEKLLPKIARADHRKDMTNLEKEMLAELKRRQALNNDLRSLTDIEWLCYAQHYGMATRLLDWTGSALTALWFACINNKDEDGEVVIFVVDKEKELRADSKNDPFNFRSTKVFKPPMVNERLIAQNGYFTLHQYSTSSSSFVPLEKNKKLKGDIIRAPVRASKKTVFLRHLCQLGVHHESLFPGFEGSCRYLNYDFDID